jgi:hypothetical protein
MILETEIVKMDKINKVIEQHTAGPQVVGFDYQFYYFMYLSLKLIQGQKIGFEVKDDIHIETPEGQALYQTKNSVLKNASGDTQNLSLLDVDLWKTLSNWSNIIKSEKENPDFLNTTGFLLVTNKNGSGNQFLSKLEEFKNNEDLDSLIEFLNNTKDSTDNDTMKKYIKTLMSLGKRKLKVFFKNLKIETGVGEIIDKIKSQIYYHVKQERFIEPVFDKLYSNLQTDKFLEINNRNKFEITFDDFTRKYGKCFQVAFEEEPLPKRSFPTILPNDLEEQTFIKQLIDIGELSRGSHDIKKYTLHMLNAINHLAYWVDKEFVLATDMSEFEKESFLTWEREFKSKYRIIRRRLNGGEKIEDVESEIKDLACELVDTIRREKLKLNETQLDSELSNGHYYALSDSPDIGWHLNWEEKYK